jgi:hypothetical protein
MLYKSGIGKGPNQSPNQTTRSLILQEVDVRFAGTDQHKVPPEKSAHQKYNDGAEEIAEEDACHHKFTTVSAYRLVPGPGG